MRTQPDTGDVGGPIWPAVLVVAVLLASMVLSAQRAGLFGVSR